MPPWSIFRLGISRTFQNIRLSLGLSIIENVMVGFYLQERTGWVDVALGRKFVQVKQTQARERAEEAIRFVSPALSRVSGRLGAELSYADRRRVEIARALVSVPKSLLLEEPTAGMNASENDELAADVRKINESM